MSSVRITPSSCNLWEIGEFDPTCRFRYIVSVEYMLRVGRRPLTRVVVAMISLPLPIFLEIQGPIMQILTSNYNAALGNAHCQALLV
jgi:hypothetical protein